MIGIYKITNLVNNKVYVGRSIHIEQRWLEHCKPSSHSAIGIAIKSYGKDNFQFEVLEECTLEQLTEKELYWIHYYNSFIPNGYNILDESDNNITHYGFINKDKINEITQDLLEDKFLTLSQIAKKYNVNVSTVSRINKGEVHYRNNLVYPLRQVSYNYGGKKKIQTKLPDEDINLNLAIEILQTSFEQVAKKYGYKTGYGLQSKLKRYGFPYTIEQLREYCKIEGVSELA